MNIARIGPRYLASFAVTASIVLFGALPSSAQTANQVVSVCAPAPLLLAIQTAIVPPNASVEDLRALTPAVIDVVPGGRAIRVSVRGTRSVSSVPTSSAKAPSGSNGSCSLIASTGTRLLDTNTVRGAEVAALAAVDHFNKAFQWPLGVVDRTDPANSVTVATQGRYAYVLITGNLSPRSLGCAAQETYRVDMSTFDVRPFQEPCLDGGGVQRILPRLRDLPNP